MLTKNARLGQCGKGGILQQIDYCKKFVSVQFLVEAGGTQLTLQAFARVITEIAEADKLSEYDLFSPRPFLLHYAANNVIQSISRSVATTKD